MYNELLPDFERAVDYYMDKGHEGAPRMHESWLSLRRAATIAGRQERKAVDRLWHIVEELVDAYFNIPSDSVWRPWEGSKSKDEDPAQFYHQKRSNLNAQLHIEIHALSDYLGAKLG